MSKHTGYRISASYVDDNGVRVSANTSEVLGESFQKDYFDLDDADEAAEELQNDGYYVVWGRGQSKSCEGFEGDRSDVELVMDDLKEADLVDEDGSVAGDAWVISGAFEYLTDSDLDQDPAVIGYRKVRSDGLSPSTTYSVEEVEVDVELRYIREWLSEDEDADPPSPYNAYLALEVTIDHDTYRIGSMVGAPECHHGQIKASGAGVRPYCTAWWADASDYENVPKHLLDFVTDELEDQAYDLYLEAMEDRASNFELAQAAETLYNPSDSA